MVILVLRGVACRSVGQLRSCRVSRVVRETHVDSMCLFNTWRRRVLYAALRRSVGSRCKGFKQPDVSYGVVGGL